MDDEKRPEFEWEEMCNAPLGYPIEVYKGGITGAGLANGLSAGNNGGWGATGSGSSHGPKELPGHINCIWVSYAEDCVYKIDCPIDYNRLLKVFQEGYQDWGFYFNGNGEYKKTTYNSIIVGFAPGGVVVIWASGAGRQVEIGRYKGEKYEVPKEEIAGLDASGYTIFDPKFRKMIMTSPNIVPIEMQNNPKPIPYGLWDSYRTRYTWKPVLEVQDDAVVIDVSLGMFNGENEGLFGKALLENKFEERAVPSGISIGWRDSEGQGYGADVYFDEKEIMDAFKEMHKDNPEVQMELYFTINHANNYVTVMLKCADKKIRLPKTKVEVIKSRKLTIEKK
nr:DUF2931 family protein [[Flexibacter] sp. ATCC 35103]